MNSSEETSPTVAKKLDALPRIHFTSESISGDTEIYVVEHEEFSSPIEIVSGAGIGVTPYTKLLARNIPSNLAGQSVADFGTGTGIQAIVASLLGAKKTVAIDISAEAVSLAAQNASRNGAAVEFKQQVNEIPETEEFDLLLCNPASLPSDGLIGHFFDGGEMGNAMIFRFLDFCVRNLSSSGHALLVHTSLVPLHLTQEFARERDLDLSFVDLEVTPFRKFYSSILERLHSMRRHHGIQYLEKDGDLYELLYVIRIQK
ncbi:50S ribosomal protein L11 methyltransferase [Stieleria neptunia]|nr:50S ribosomal protein L11 methyltransferase [Stieleria neptunia]